MIGYLNGYGYDLDTGCFGCIGLGFGIWFYID